MKLANENNEISTLKINNSKLSFISNQGKIPFFLQTSHPIIYISIENMMIGNCLSGQTSILFFLTLIIPDGPVLQILNNIQGSMILNSSYFYSNQVNPIFSVDSSPQIFIDSSTYSYGSKTCMIINNVLKIEITNTKIIQYSSQFHVPGIIITSWQRYSNANYQV